MLYFDTFRDRIAAATTATAGKSSKDSSILTTVVSHHKPDPIRKTTSCTELVHRHSSHLQIHLHKPSIDPQQYSTAHQCSSTVRRTKAIMTTPAPRERTGACLCGRIKYRVLGESVYDTFCHCIPCRKWTGSVAFTAAICPKEVSRWCA